MINGLNLGSRLESMRWSYIGTFRFILINFTLLRVFDTLAVNAKEICKDAIQHHLQEPFECEIDECILNQRNSFNWFRSGLLRLWSIQDGPYFGFQRI